MARGVDVKGLLGIWQEATGEGQDGLLKLMQHVVQRVLEEELSAYLQAEPHERTEERAGYRNGYKPRTLTTRLGRMEFMVPKDREGRFQTELFERYQRSEKALMLSLVEMYVHGVSTRKVKAITEALCGLDISRSQVSRLAKDLDEDIHAWRFRKLEKEYPYLVVDARYERIRIIVDPSKRETVVRVMYNGPGGLAEGGRRPTGDRPPELGTRGVSCGNRSLRMSRRWR